MRISDWSSDVCSSDLLSQQLRAAGLNVETQLEPRKLAKQLQYADRAGIRFVVIRGEDEDARGAVAVKDLRRGEQFEVTEADWAQWLLDAQKSCLKRRNQSPALDPSPAKAGEGPRRALEDAPDPTRHFGVGRARNTQARTKK